MSRSTPVPAVNGSVDEIVVLAGRDGVPIGTTENPLFISANAGTAVIGKVSPLTSSTLTASQVTVPATADGILLLAANAARVGATISNPSAVTVYVSSAATGLTTSNGYGIPAGGTLSLNSPLYAGALYGIVAAATQVVTAVEWT
jgi:hypothetical protein